MGEEIYRGNKKILALTTFAFFISFFVWFNMAPLTTTLREVFDLTSQQVSALLTANLALTIPARVLIGMLVDRFGPRKVYAGLLMLMSIPCFAFALANSYWQLFISRLFLGLIGAGFVIGIRMVSEWFPPKNVGLAEGIYGGWGNFGSSAAAFTLPALALFFGGEQGWRYAIGATGVIALVYGVVYLRTVRDTPEGVKYQRPKSKSALEVSSYRDLLSLVVMTFPMYLILGVFAWQLLEAAIIQWNAALWTWLILLLLCLVNVVQVCRVNLPRLKKGVPKEEQYSFKQVVILEFAYFVTFGSELAVVSMLPQFFEETYSLGIAQAGMLGASFAFMNLVARPGGGLLSDKFGRKKVLTMLLAGVGLSYLTMSQIDGGWPIAMAVVLTMITSFFVQAGEGAVFSIVPLVKKMYTGQIAGMVGSFGNIGSTAFLTVLAFINPSVFFMVIGLTAFACLGCAFFLQEPDVTASNVSTKLSESDEAAKAQYSTVVAEMKLNKS